MIRSINSFKFMLEGYKLGNLDGNVIVVYNIPYPRALR